MTEPTGTTDPNAADGGQQSVGDGTGGETVITMSPEKLNERLKRERDSVLKQFSDYDTYKAAADELKKLKEKDLSEQELLKARIADMEQAAADLDAQAKTRETEVNKKLLRAEVRVMAKDMDFIDPEDAWARADLTGATFDDDGKIEGIEKPLKELAKASPHLIKTAGGPGRSPPNEPGKKASKDAELEQAMTDARQRFNIKDYSKQPTGGKE